MTQKPLRFVQRGRILLRCGSAFALSLPSLGVSSLDLGRLFNQAALFSFGALFFHRHSGFALRASESFTTALFRRGLERSELAERNGGQRIGQSRKIGGDLRESRPAFA